MQAVLGFMNQNEWVYNLNIGNVMQISPVLLTDVLAEPQLAVEMTRDSFLSKISMIAVAYFCMSTETRFIR